MSEDFSQVLRMACKFTRDQVPRGMEFRHIDAHGLLLIHVIPPREMASLLDQAASEKLLPPARRVELTGAHISLQDYMADIAMILDLGRHRTIAFLSPGQARALGVALFSLANDMEEESSAQAPMIGGLSNANTAKN